MKRRSPLDADLYAVIFNRVPRLCVDLWIRDRAGRILLARRSIEPWRGRWHLPGGGVRFRETIAQAAARRIARDELGVTVKPGPVVCTCEMPYDDKGAAPRHSVSIVLACSVVSGRPRPRAGATAVRYFARVPKATHPYHGRLLRRR